MASHVGFQPVAVGAMTVMHAQRAQLQDGRWHFQHGPINIIIGAEGDAVVLSQAHDHAWERFKTILQELVDELPALRQPVRRACPVQSPVAQRMWSACRPYQSSFITPMAAVAGSVAQELLQFYQASGIRRAHVNNGGDVAIYLEADESIRVGMYANLARLDARQLRNGLTLDGHFEVRSSSPVRGVATSGWRGRSFSLGIADSVTVLARTAAEADAAATVIANAVNVDDSRIIRRPACQIKDDSDLGNRLVTVDVPALPDELVNRALASGLACASTLRARKLICSAVLVCQNRCVTTDVFKRPAYKKRLTAHACGTEHAAVQLMEMT
jgi:uncharacterized protein